MPVGTPFGRRCSVNICPVCTPHFTDKAESYHMDLAHSAQNWTNSSVRWCEILVFAPKFAILPFRKIAGTREFDRICETQLHLGRPAVWRPRDVHRSIRWIHMLREMHGLKFKWRIKNDDSRASAHPMWLTSACYANHEKRHAKGVSNEDAKVIQPPHDGIYDKQPPFEWVRHACQKGSPLRAQAGTTNHIYISRSSTFSERNKFI